MSLRRARELAFLPAVLEVEHTPPLPAFRLLLWLLVALLGAVIAWAAVGRVDIVSVAPGRVVPRGQVKIVQPLEAATVKAIRVREGQHVAAGDTLFELDSTAAQADYTRLVLEQQALRLDRTRLRALLEDVGAAETAEAPTFTATPEADLARLQWQAQRAEFQAARDEIESTRRARRAALAAAGARIVELTESLPLLTEEADAHATLVTRGGAPRVAWLALERQRISMRQGLRAHREQHLGLTAELTALDVQWAATRARFRVRWSLELAEVERRLHAAREELAKTSRRLALTQLRAPCAGTVQQLSVHTIGGVVTPAQPLLVIVPAAAALEVEAQIPNRDRGFVHPGQEVIVKVDTFDFTKYGTLRGRLRDLSRDAIDDERLGAYYRAHVTLAQTRLGTGSAQRPLAPGMRVSVEVMLGQRRLIEYLLSPLLRYRQEVARERGTGAAAGRPGANRAPSRRFRPAC